MVHRRLVYIYLLNVHNFSSRYFNKIKRTSRLGRLLALSLEILCLKRLLAIVPHGPNFYRIMLIKTFFYNFSSAENKAMITSTKVNNTRLGNFICI